MARDWTTEDFTSFIDQHFDGDTSDSIKEQRVDGSDLAAHISGCDFDATEFCKELDWNLDKRKMNMLKRRPACVVAQKITANTRAMNPAPAIRHA